MAANSLQTGYRGLVHGACNNYKPLSLGEIECLKAYHEARLETGEGHHMHLPTEEERNISRLAIAALQILIEENQVPF